MLLPARTEMARLLCAIVVRFERLVRSVREALRDSVNLWRKVEQLVNVDDRILPPNRKERPIVKPGVTVTRVDKALDLRGGNGPSTRKPPSAKNRTINVFLLSACAMSSSTSVFVSQAIITGEPLPRLTNFHDTLTTSQQRPSAIAGAACSLDVSCVQAPPG